MSKTNNSDGLEAVAKAIDELDDEKRQELRMLSETLNAPKSDEEIERIARNAVEASSDRRSFLKGAGTMGLAGLIGGGAGSAAAQTGAQPNSALAVGSVTSNTYQIAGNRYGGPASARTELNSELGSSDVGARFAADDNGGEYYWDGSSWVLLDGTVGSLNAEKSVTVTTGEAANTLHYGSNQDRANAGDNSVAVGIGARTPTDRTVAVAYQAAQNNTGFGVTVSGYQAARDNTGFGVTVSGYQAAQNNTGNRVTASGYQAAQNNTGLGVTASGQQAAQSNTGNRVTASGYRAAQNNTGARVTASGQQAARGDGLADPTTMGDDNIGIGASAIRNNQASGLIAIGQEAGTNAQTDDQLIITDRNGNRRIEADLSASLDFSLDGTSETNDGMTADPESATEDGYLTININGTDYQTPLYSA